MGEARSGWGEGSVPTLTMAGAEARGAAPWNGEPRQGARLQV